MPCKDAMITNVIEIDPDQTIGQAIDILKSHSIRSVPVVDKDRKLVGYFSLHQLLKSLLPVSVTMEDGLQRLNFIMGAAPTVAKRLQTVKDHRVGEHMDRNIAVVSPETATWEALRLVVKYGSPLPVVDEKSGVLQGLMSEQSILNELEEVYKEMESNPDSDEEEE